MARPNKTGTKWRSGSPEEKEKMREYQRKYRKENLEKVRLAARRSALMKLYGISLENYQDMFDAQGGCCAICNQISEEEHLCVDHCHQTNEVRGLLCRTCNRALGLFKDDPEILDRAKEYVS